MHELMRQRPPPRVWLFVVVLAAGALALVLGDAAARDAATRAGAVNQTVRVEVRGPGRVVSVPQGILCSPSCSREFVSGAKVVLIAAHDTGSGFVGWEGDCVGRAAWCVLIAQRDLKVVARFRGEPNQDVGLIVRTKYRLYVTAPRVGGTIRSAGGVNCPRSCESIIPRGTSVTLEARAAPGYASAASWQTHPPGLCGAAARRCKLRIETTTHVSAAFRR